MDASSERKELGTGYSQCPVSLWNSVTWFVYSITLVEISYGANMGGDLDHTFPLDLLSLFRLLNMLLLLFGFRDALPFVGFGVFGSFGSGEQRIFQPIKADNLGSSLTASCTDLERLAKNPLDWLTLQKRSEGFEEMTWRAESSPRDVYLCQAGFEHTRCVTSGVNFLVNFPP